VVGLDRRGGLTRWEPCSLGRRDLYHARLTSGGGLLSDGSGSEALTRRDLIDPRLERWGWKVVPFPGSGPVPQVGSFSIAEYPTSAGPADYALVSNGRIVGIVEAKKLTLGPQNVLTQAQRYSRGLEDSPFDFGGCRVPFLYSTNGEVLWFHDVRDPLNLSRQISHFHTPGALEELLQSESQASHARLQDLGFSGLLRPYQVEAIEAVEGSIQTRRPSLS
jgi:type I restriction enzyme R subunit